MTPLFALWFALLSVPATTPAIPPPSESPAAQPTQQPATNPDQAAPAGPYSTSPNASPALRVGGGVTPPQVIKQPAPQYSKIARKQKITGIATVSLIVDKQGNPANVHISKSISDTVGKDKNKQAAALSLDQAAVDAVKQYKFKPAMMNGKPVAVYLKIEVNFEIY